MAKNQPKWITATGLEEPWPSSPSRPPRCCVHFRSTARDLHFALNAYAPYAMRSIIDRVLINHTYTWTDDDTIAVPALHLTIRSEQLEALMDYDLSPAEAAFVPGQPYSTYIRQIRDEAPIAAALPDDDRSPPVPKVTNPDLHKAPSRHKTRRAASTEEMVTIAQIADQLGITSREARQRARKRSISKPGSSWEWKKNDVDRVIALLR